jgi:hypothetical protein
MSAISSSHTAASANADDIRFNRITAQLAERQRHGDYHPRRINHGSEAKCLEVP